MRCGEWAWRILLLGLIMCNQGIRILLSVELEQIGLIWGGVLSVGGILLIMFTISKSKGKE